MPTRTFVRDLSERIGETVTVCGWVHTLRLQRKVQFVLVRDGTGIVQTVHQRGGAADSLEQQLDQLTVESAVMVTGKVVDNPIVKLGGLEVMVESVKVANRAESPLPIDEHSGLDHRLDWRFLDLRRATQQLIFEVQGALEQGMRTFALGNGFRELHTPKLMGAASESGADVFRLDYFGRSGYLAQSPQFYKQMAIAGGFDRVFEVGPVFRAEPSFTARHATEFTGVDAEMAWIDSVEDVMRFEEQMLAATLERVRASYGQAAQELLGVSVRVPSLPFPRVTMREAIALLRADGWDPEGGREDLDPEGERLISAHVRRAYGHEFVYVTRFPATVRPFYHMRPDDDPGVTESFDLLWNGIEVTTGAQREHRYDILCKQAVEKGIDLETMRDYLNCFRFGCPPHGGFGLGLNRLLMVTLDLGSIREATLLFRGPNRLTP